MTVRFFSLAFLLGIVIGTARAEAPRLVGSLYQCTVHSLAADQSGNVVETPYTALLKVVSSEEPGAAPKFEWELETPDDLRLIRVRAQDMPAEYAGLIGEGKSYVFRVQGTGYGPSGRDIRFALDPSDEQALASSEQTVFFEDPWGNPAAGLKVKVALSEHYGLPHTPRLVLSEETSDSGGAVTIRYPLSPAGENSASGSSMQAGQPQRVFLEIIEPETGQVMQMRYPGFSPIDPRDEPSNHIAIPAVGIDPTSRQDIYYGKVVDSNEAPVAGALIHFFSLQLPAGGLIQPTGGAGEEMATVYTGASGEFRFGFPSQWLKKRTGQGVLPPGARLSVQVRPPDERSTELHYAEVNIQPGKPESIILPHGVMLTCRLLNEEGQPRTDLEKFLRYYGDADIKRTDIKGGTPAMRAVVKPLGPDTFLVGPVILPGVYAFHINNVDYDAQQIDAEKAQTVIDWSVDRRRVVFLGKVLDATTGSPIQGAYVAMGYEQSAPWTLATMPQEDRDKYFASVPIGGFINPSGEDSRRLSDGRMWYAVHALARSASDGSFHIEGPQGKECPGLYIYAPGYILMKSSIYNLNTQIARPKFGEFTFPDVALYPAATATVTALAPGHIPDPKLQSEGLDPERGGEIGYALSFDPPAAWTSNAPRSPDSPNNEMTVWEPEYAQTWSNYGEETTLHIPANVPFTVGASVPYMESMGSVSWKVDSPVPPGGHIDLDPKVIPAKYPFIVHVRKADGTPVAGVGVRIDGHIGTVTDEAGNAVCWSSGSVRNVAVTGDERSGWHPLAEQRDVDIPQTEEPYILEMIVKEN